MTRNILKQQKLDDKVKVFQQIDKFIDDDSYLLDVGCGSGSFIKHMERTKPINAFGVDINEGHDYVGMFEHVNFDKKFNVITLLETLEHVKQPNKVLQKCRDIMTTNGTLIIEVPHFKYHYLKGKVEKLLGLKVWGLMPHVHYQFFTPETLKRMLNNNGFRVIACGKRDITLNGKRKYSKGYVWLSHLLTKVLGSAFIMVARKEG